MADFNIDQLKKSWQEQQVSREYESTDIESMLNRSSRNYVKYIFQISLAEFLFFFFVNVYYFFSGNDVADAVAIIKKLGVMPRDADEKTLVNIYLLLKVTSIILTAYFVVQFYLKYRKIDIESSLKTFILQIIDFKKTVKNFIFANIILLIGSISSLALFTLYLLNSHNISLKKPEVLAYGLGLGISLLIGVGIIWLYYRLVYGILLRRLNYNLEQLQQSDSPEHTISDKAT